MQGSKVSNEKLKTLLPIRNCEIWNDLRGLVKRLDIGFNDFCSIFGAVLIAPDTKGVVNMEGDDIVLESALVSIISRMPNDLAIIKNILNCHAGSFMVRASVPLLEDMERNQQKSMVDSLIFALDETWIPPAMAVLMESHCSKTGEINSTFL